jgi:hypothetical protein
MKELSSPFAVYGSPVERTWPSAMSMGWINVSVKNGRDMIDLQFRIHSFDGGLVSKLGQLRHRNLLVGERNSVGFSESLASENDSYANDKLVDGHSDSTGKWKWLK